MKVQRFSCDASEWEFALSHDGVEFVALLFFRGELYGPEFRAHTSQQLQLSIARWLLLHAERAGGLLQ